MFVVRLIGVLFLVALNGFFAAAEFSLVAVRLSRVRQLVAKGNIRAQDRRKPGRRSAPRRFRRAAGHHAHQPGPRRARRSHSGKFFPLAVARNLGNRSAILAHALALTVAFVLLTALHVVIGELVPKTVSLARAERVALLIARPFRWFLNTFRWAIDLLEAFPARSFVPWAWRPSRPRRRALHRGIADSDSAGARARLAGSRRRKIHSQRHRTRPSAGARNHGAAAGHAHFSAWKPRWMK